MSKYLFAILVFVMYGCCEDIDYPHESIINDELIEMVASRPGAYLMGSDISTSTIITKNQKIAATKSIYNKYITYNFNSLVNEPRVKFFHYGDKNISGNYIWHAEVIFKDREQYKQYVTLKK